MPVAPVFAPITSKYGLMRKRKNKVTGIVKEYRHAGVDYKALRGSTVRASAGGVVVRASLHNGRLGNLIIIYHGPNRISGKHSYTLYAHLQEMDVSLARG